MANTFNTGVYPQEWMIRLQQRLDAPINWKEVADVTYSNTQIFNVPYMATEFVIQTGTRGTAYGFSDFTLTNNTLTINTYKPVPVFIDRADLAQCQYATQMETADRQGSVVNEQVESAMLADHASWTNFGDTGGGVLGLAATTFTVSATNIPAVVRGLRREVVKANGADYLSKNGLFIIWRAADFEFLEQFAQNNGFQLADTALKSGLPYGTGYFFLGAYHYVSTKHTANHLFAGVRKLYRIGILKETYGQIVVTQDPNLQSGIGIISRVDYGLLTPTVALPLLFDVNVV